MKGFLRTVRDRSNRRSRAPRRPSTRRALTRGAATVRRPQRGGPSTMSACMSHQSTNGDQHEQVGSAGIEDRFRRQTHVDEVQSGRGDAERRRREVQRRRDEVERVGAETGSQVDATVVRQIGREEGLKAWMRGCRGARCRHRGRSRLVGVDLAEIMRGRRGGRKNLSCASTPLSRPTNEATSPG